VSRINLTGDEIREWISHPTTKAQLHNLKLMVDSALKGVLGAARTSSDEKVRDAAATHRSYEMMLRILQEANGSDKDSEPSEE
jgi:hypothetical protein